MGSVKQIVRDQRGVVESALVLIPLILLFLVTLELIAAVNFRNVDASFAQSDASVRAITGSLYPRDEIVTLATRDSKRDLRIMISHRSRSLPGFGGGYSWFSGSGSFSTDAVGIAFLEENP